jgi:fumarylacetoacetase
MGLLRSWVEGANEPGCPFPLNNLPCGVLTDRYSNGRCVVAIGTLACDLSAMEREGLLQFGDRPVFGEPAWNAFMALGPGAWSELRGRLTELLAEDAAKRERVEPHLVPVEGERLLMPFRVAGYTDFYAGRHHAENVGTMFRGAENALPPNWLHIPIGYNGRASSVVVSGAPVRRPWGQIRPQGTEAPIFAPSRRFDIELELGAIVGTPSGMDRPVTVAEAEQMIFGYVLLNDWSARDIQAWEYQPLGPFQAKATATTISPWIVPAEALRPFRAPGQPREVPLLPYLKEPHPMGLDIALEVELTPEGGRPTVISRTNARELTYSFPQQLAHHTTSGCPMETGDLLGSGTISGPTWESRGSLLELSWSGKEPIAIEGGTRTFIEDGDTLTLRGEARGDGFTIGFGECAGQVLPALPDPYAR